MVRNSAADCATPHSPKPHPHGGYRHDYVQELPRQTQRYWDPTGPGLNATHRRTTLTMHSQLEAVGMLGVVVLRQRWDALIQGGLFWVDSSKILHCKFSVTRIQPRLYDRHGTTTPSMHRQQETSKDGVNMYMTSKFKLYISLQWRPPQDKQKQDGSCSSL